jgi:hypothetical protein
MPQNPHAKYTYRRPVAAVPAKNKPEVKGDAHLWVTLQAVKDAATGATKTTRAMEVPGGLVLNTCTRGASYAAEALVFVPGATLMKGTAAAPAQIVAQS